MVNSSPSCLRFARLGRLFFVLALVVLFAFAVVAFFAVAGLLTDLVFGLLAAAWLVFFDASALVSFLSVALLEAGFVDAVDLAAVFLVFFMFVVEVLTGFDFPALLTDFWGAFLAVGLSVSLTVALFGFLEAFCFA